MEPTANLRWRYYQGWKQAAAWLIECEASCFSQKAIKGKVETFLESSQEMITDCVAAENIESAYFWRGHSDALKHLHVAELPKLEA